jgi:hypothetical protein
MRGRVGALSNVMRIKSSRKRGEEPIVEQASEEIRGGAHNRDGEM